MWHILTHTTNEDNILKILKDGIIGAKDSRHKKIDSMVYFFYLSSLLENKNIKRWNFSSATVRSNMSIIIGFNPHILNNKKFLMCDRRGGAACFKQKYKVVESHYNTQKPINFIKINDFINSRIGTNITNNKEFSNKILKNYLIYIISNDLEDYYSYVDNKFHDLKKVEKINNKIKEIENLPDDKVLDMYNKIFKNDMKLDEERKYVESHEVVVDGPISTKDINFIMISKKANDEFKNELKKICPAHIKIIEIELNDFSNYTKRIQKVLEKNSEHIEL